MRTFCWCSKIVITSNALENTGRAFSVIGTIIRGQLFERVNRMLLMRLRSGDISGGLTDFRCSSDLLNGFEQVFRNVFEMRTDGGLLEGSIVLLQSEGLGLVSKVGFELFRVDDFFLQVFDARFTDGTLGHAAEEIIGTVAEGVQG